MQNSGVHFIRKRNVHSTDCAPHPVRKISNLIC